MNLNIHFSDVHKVIDRETKSDKHIRRRGSERQRPTAVEEKQKEGDRERKEK